MEILILIGYVLLTIAVGFFFTQRSESNTESYFLSNRNLKWVTLFFTLIATNFSAFFFLGFAGEGYRKGFSYYPMMALGTSFAAISFYIIGNKAWHLGKEKGFITPVEMIRYLSGNSSLGSLFLFVMAFFMIPFMAVQPIGAGLILENLTGGAISYQWGVIGMTIFILLYVWLGGMKSVVAMDVKNGILILLMMLLALVVIFYNMGDTTDQLKSLYQKDPELFSTSGKSGFFTPARWISFMILWLTCLPMFPQIFTRFLMAKEIEGFKKSTFLYTLIPPFLFLIPVTIGVLGNITFPEIIGKDSDKILPMMLGAHSPRWLTVLIMFGALAAFMSTVDSILLALSTMGTRDVYKKFINPNASEQRQVFVGRGIIFFLSMIALVIALYRPASIFAIVTNTFAGVSLLFPITVAFFYGKNISAVWSTVGLIIGLVMLAGFQLKWIPMAWIGTWLPVVPCLVAVSLFTFSPSLFAKNQ